MAQRIPRVPVREQDPKVRAHNFEEVCYGYNLEEATTEASRCLHCKNPRCVQACPVSVKIPEFIAKVAAGDIAGAAAIIAEDSSLPAVCGRVCPQESQCEGKCTRGIKNEPVGIGRLERFVADWHNAHSTEAPEKPQPNGHKVAVVGSGPAGLTCAGDLAKKGYEVTVFEALHLAANMTMIGDSITVVTHPASTTHKQLSDADLTAAGVTPTLLRISLGLENADDLIEDFEQAFAQIG